MSAIMLWRERQQFVMQSDRADCEKPSGVLSFPQFSLVVGKAPTGKKKEGLSSSSESWNMESWEKLIFFQLSYGNCGSLVG